MGTTNGFCEGTANGKHLISFKSHCVPEGECRVGLAGDELSEKSRTFVFSEGGHTFGNALRSIISRYPEVLLCGYTVPHPSQADMHFRIQTAGPRAIDVLRRGIEDLEKLCDHTFTTFQVEMEAYQQAAK